MRGWCGTAAWLTRLWAFRLKRLKGIALQMRCVGSVAVLHGCQGPGPSDPKDVHCPANAFQDAWVVRHCCMAVKALGPQIQKMYIALQMRSRMR
eukprot:1138490-Pelagomonas_calceolata.AAC.1